MQTEGNEPKLNSTHAQIIPNVKRIKLEKIRVHNYVQHKEKLQYIAKLKQEKYQVRREFRE